MQNLIEQLEKLSRSKPSPGPILNKLGEEKLKEIAERYPEHDSEALWMGAYLADLFITEAILSGDITKHVPMALEFAEKFLEENKIDSKKCEIILEIIGTHHGGEQKFIESKLFKNADAFKFLEPKGIFHIFSSQYKPFGTEEGFAKGMEYAIFKVDEKFRLVDLDDELKVEAKMLYDKAMWSFERMGVKLSVPDLYKKN